MAADKQKKIQRKIPPQKLLPDSSLNPVEGSFYALSPRFSFIHIHSKYCLNDCEPAEKAAILDKLSSLSQLTWAQIWKAPRQGVGAEPLPGRIYKKMPLELKNKSDKYLIFRFGHKGRLIGFHEHDTLHIVWFDRNHEVCS